MSDTQLTFERTLLARDGGTVRWSLTVLNSNSQPLTSRPPAEVDRATATVVSRSANGAFDAEELDWPFTVAPRGRAELELAADLLPGRTS